MNQRLNRSVRLAAVCATSAALAVAPALTAATASAAPAPTPPAAEHSIAASPADGTAEGAIEWFEQNSGDSSYESYCEKAVENAWGATGVWPSAIDHWQGSLDAGKGHEGDTDPPAGAFVYWNTSEYGHVGIADGNGGFYSSSIDGALGHADDLSYFGNYLGWSDPQVPG